MRIPASLCIKCKGTKKLCGLPECPLLSEYKNRLNIINILERKSEVTGSTPPSFLVGEKNYPKVSYYYHLVPEVKGNEAKEYDNPSSWWGKKSLTEIVNLRTSMLSGIINLNVRDPWILYTKEYGLASISERPVETELDLLKKPKQSIFFDPILKPHGLASPVKKIIVLDNPKIGRKAEALIWEDIVAYEALLEGYKAGLDVYTLIKMFSIGFLGRLKKRRLVPTRWSITAVDDVISHYLRKKIINYDTINEYRIYFSDYLYNRFIIVLLPGSYEAHWFEIWHPKSIWAMNSINPGVHYVKEDWNGVVKPKDGGFSAARLSALEYLDKQKKQAKVIIIREVLPQYIVPVGNWHIRESVKKAFLSSSEKTTDLDELMGLIEKKLVYKAFLSTLRKKIDKWVSQKHIDDYFEGMKYSVR